jgi:tRNA(adenine34) deaminase
MEIVDHSYYMGRAYQEALCAFDEGEVPVGAVIVGPSGTIMGRGRNSVERLKDATAHAEIVAIGAAANSREDWRLEGCSLYVTLEPCLMCLGAILHSRLDTVIYGTPDPRLGAIDTFFFRQEAERSHRRFPHIVSGVMADECASLMSSFFDKIRKKN